MLAVEGLTFSQEQNDECSIGRFCKISISRTLPSWHTADTRDLATQILGGQEVEEHFRERMATDG